MVRNSSADLPEFALGVISVLAKLPGVAFLTDTDGRLVFGNNAYREEVAATGDPDASILPKQILRDVLGTGLPGFHALTLPSQRRIGLSCQRLSHRSVGSVFVVAREDERQAVVAKFASAQEGLLRSRLERDRALAAEERLRAEANHWRMVSMSDRLTGLYNATGFRDRAASALAEQDCGALIYVDLNGFKQVNDVLGHAKGDMVLSDVGQSLQMAVRSGDLVGRLGGDEFAIFLPDCPQDDLPKVVDRLRKSMTRRIPVRAAGDRPAQILFVSPAIGTATFPEEGCDLDQLLELADGRMYEDKSAAARRRNA